MRDLLETPSARRFFIRMLDDAGVLAPNPQLSAVAEGKRQMGLLLIDAMSAVDPYAFPNLMIEAATLARQQPDNGDEPDDDE